MNDCGLDGLEFKLFSLLGVGIFFWGCLLFVVRILVINILIKNNIYKKLGSPRILMLADLLPLSAFFERFKVESVADRRLIVANMVLFFSFVFVFVSFAAYFIYRCN